MALLFRAGQLPSGRVPTVAEAVVVGTLKRQRAGRPVSKHDAEAADVAKAATL